MKILHKNLKKGIVKVQIENLDDLWHLSAIIDPGDIIEGTTIRKIKVGEDQKNVIRKPVFIKLVVEKIDAGDQSLRATGKIIEGPEDIPHGTYHTFNLEPQTVCTVIKESWLSFQLDKLEEAARGAHAPILIVAVDREDAIFAVTKQSNYQILSSLKGTVSKKAVEEKIKNTFYEEVISQLKGYDAHYQPQRIILASPIFWKEEVIKELTDPLIKKKIIQAACSSVDKNAIAEIIKRPETQEALKQERVAQEMALVEEVLVALAKDGAATYGFKHVQDAISSGAAKKVLVSYTIIKEYREKDMYGILDRSLKSAESTQAEVHIISPDHEGGKKLDGLGGIAAVLRYKIQ